MTTINFSQAWWKQSNRQKHIAYGLLIYIATMAFSLLIGFSMIQATIVGAMCATVAAVTKEYTDHQHGGLFDWLDALATVLLPYFLTLIFILINILSWLL